MKTTNALEDQKKLALAAIDQRKGDLINLCTEVIRRPTPNPPGDTKVLSDYIESLLRAKGLPVEYRTRKASEPNLISSTGTNAHPHLVLCGHMDVFPAPDEQLWTVPPWSGEVRDGKIYGRGTSDMKGGLTALLFVYMLLKDLGITPPGKLSFIAVSDEEDGGPDGMNWLLDTYPELRGDAGMIAEPNSVDQVSIANKGIMHLILEARGEAYHGGLAAGENSITSLARAVVALKSLVDVEVTPPAEMAEVLRIQESLNRTGADERKGMGWLARRFGVNVGTFNAGVRFNVAPHKAQASIDIRLPLGTTLDEGVAKVRETLDKAGCSDVTITPDRGMFYPPHFTSPKERLPQIVRKNVTEITGKEPIFIMTFPSGDVRNFRLRGIPAIVYGTNPYNVGGFDEFISVDDLVTVAKVYTSSILEYFFGETQP